MSTAADLLPQRDVLAAGFKIPHCRLQATTRHHVTANVSETRSDGLGS